MKREELKLYTTTYIRQNTVQQFFRIEVVSNDELEEYDGDPAVSERIDISKFVKRFDMELAEEAKEIAEDYDFYKIKYGFEYNEDFEKHHEKLVAVHK